MSETTFNEDAIAVIGMACRYPGSPDIHAFWENLSQGRELITHFSEEELAHMGQELLDNPSNYVIMTLAGGKRDYTGIDITFRKAMSNNWQMLASYTNGDAKGNSNSDSNADLQGDFEQLRQDGLPATSSNCAAIAVASGPVASRRSKRPQPPERRSSIGAEVTGPPAAASAS